MSTQPIASPPKVEDAGPFPFRPRELDVASSEEIAQRALDAVETMSRKIEDLARELNCLGYFDDDDDRPRAA